MCVHLNAFESLLSAVVIHLRIQYSNFVRELSVLNLKIYIYMFKKIYDV